MCKASDGVSNKRIARTRLRRFIEGDLTIDACDKQKSCQL